MMRSLRVQSQQLMVESQILEDDVLAGAKSADHPTEEMSERRDHSRNQIGTVRIELCGKPFILQVYDVLARNKSVLLSEPCFPGVIAIKRAVLSLGRKQGLARATA